MINTDFDRYSTKRISYILVTKNRATYLTKALERAKKFKKKYDELIIVDGASTDNTLKIIKSFGTLIDKVISEPDNNPTHATNKAILISKGTYIKLIPDDDIFYEKGIEQALSILKSHPEIDILECGGYAFNSTSKATSTYYKPPGTNFGTNVDDMFRYRSGGMAIFIKRSSFAKVGLFPEGDLISDATFIAKCFKKRLTIKFARIKVFKIIIHGSNIALDPVVSELIFKCVKKNASKKYFIRYAINYYISKIYVLKIILSPIIFVNNYFKKTQSSKSTQVYNWDGGFS